MKPMVYIFRGAPASGKDTVIPEFCKLLPAPVALISQDTLRWGFHLIGRTPADIDDSEHMFANGNTVLLFEEYLKNGRYTIVLEGLFSWDNSNTSQGSAIAYTDLSEKYGYQVKNILLKASRETLLKRNEARDYVVSINEFDSLYRNIYESVEEREVIIDSTNQTVNETIEALKQLID